MELPEEISAPTPPEPSSLETAILQTASPGTETGEQPETGEQRWVPWWGGVLALIVGGVLSQLMGAIPLVIGAVFWMAEHGDGSPTAIERMMRDLTHNFWVLGPSIVLTGGTMVLVAVATAKIAKAPLRSALGFRGAPWPTFLAAPVGILALGPTSDFLLRMMQEYLPWATLGALEGLDEIARSAPIYLILPAMALTPGFAEEILFRGAFQRSIRIAPLAVFLSGLLFACYHMDPHHVVAVLPLGFYLAWLGQRTKSLAVPITGHVFNNAAAVIATVYFASEASEEVLDWWWMPIGWTLCAGCVALVWWTTQKVED